MNENGYKATGILQLSMLAALILLVIIAFWQSYQSLFDLWQHSDHRYAVLVFPIAAFLMWGLRKDIAPLIFEPDVLGLFGVAGLLAVWAVARVAGIQVVEHAAVLSMIPAIVFAIAGREVTRVQLFPLLFFLLAIPVGESLVPHLMLITADLSTAFLRASGIPVLRDGQFLSLPGGDFVVADVCSGLRYLVTGVMVATLYSYLTFKSVLRRAAFILATAVALVFANAVRAYLIMMIASSSNMQYLAGRDHVYFGWALFGLVIMGLLWFGGRFSDREVSSDEPAPSNRQALGLIVALGLIMLAVTLNPLQADVGATGKFLLLALVIFFIVAVGYRVGRVNRTGQAASSHPLIEPGVKSTVIIAVAITLIVITTRSDFFVWESQQLEFLSQTPTPEFPNCTSEKPWQSTWMPEMHAADYENSTQYFCSGAEVGLYVAGYSSVRQGEELIGTRNHLMPREWEGRVKPRVTNVDAGQGNHLTVNEVVAGDSLIWYWYRVDGAWVATGTRVKARQIIAILTGRPAGGELFLLKTGLASDYEISRSRLEVFTRALGTAIDQ